MIKTHANYFNKCNGIKLIYLGGELMIIMYNQVKIYNILTNNWNSYNIIKHDQKLLVSNKECCIYKNKIYVTQSYWDNNNEIKKYNSFPLLILEYNDSKFILTQFNSSSMLIKSRKGHSMIAFNDKLWVAGGKHQDEYLNDLEVFDFEIGLWKTQINKMNRKRINFKLQVINHTLYAIGGDIDYDDFLITIEKYDHLKDTWNIITNKNIISFYSFVVMENKIFLFTNNINEHNHIYCEIYDTINNNWTKTNINIHFFENAHLDLISTN